jgi:hypothetical protein
MLRELQFIPQDISHNLCELLSLVIPLYQFPESFSISVWLLQYLVRMSYFLARLFFYGTKRKEGGVSEARAYFQYQFFGGLAIIS